MTTRNLHIDVKVSSPHNQQLLNLLTGNEDYRRWPKGSKLFFRLGDDAACHFVRRGNTLLARIDDAFSMGILTAPTAMGFTRPTCEHLYLRTLEECDIATLPYERVMALVEEKKAWALMAKHIMFVTNKLFIYSEMLTAPTSYDILRYQLQMLIQEPENVRSSTSAWQYILDRTRLSRSSIMKMLAELKKGDYIQLENGKLTAIHRLPARF
jgi:CRP-like cAMP-binding protein